MTHSRVPLPNKERGMIRNLPISASPVPDNGLCQEGTGVVVLEQPSLPLSALLPTLYLGPLHSPSPWYRQCCWSHLYHQAPVKHAFTQVAQLQISRQSLDIRELSQKAGRINTWGLWPHCQLCQVPSLRPLFLPWFLNFCQGDIDLNLDCKSQVVQYGSVQVSSE